MAGRSPRSRHTGGARLLVALLVIATTVACGDDPPAEPRASATPTTKSPSALPTQPKATHPSIIATISTGEGPITLAASAEDVWVELHRENHLARIDPTTNEQVEVLDVPPVHCSIAATDQSVWTAIFDGRRVSRVDVATGQVVQTADIPGCVMTVEGDSAWVVSPSTGDVYRLVEGRAGVVEQHHVGDQTFVPALTEKHLWVTSEADGGTLLRMDRATHRVTNVGRFPLIDSLVVAFGHRGPDPVTAATSGSSIRPPVACSASSASTRPAWLRTQDACG